MSFEDAKEKLRAMMTQAAEFTEIAGGPVTSAVSCWLAPMYAATAQRRLASVTEEKERFEVMRAFVRDWAVLRGGDQAEDRIAIENKRVELLRDDLSERSKPLLEKALDAMMVHVMNNPPAWEAFKALADLVPTGRPWDPKATVMKEHEKRKKEGQSQW